MVEFTLCFPLCNMGILLSSMEGGLIDFCFPLAKTFSYTRRLEFGIVFHSCRGVVGILSKCIPRIRERGHSRRGNNSRGRMENKNVDVVAFSNLSEHKYMNIPPLNT
jgi:hypothetical protein